MAENRENQYSGQLSQGTGSREENKGGDSRPAVSGCLEQDSVWLNQKLATDRNFDVVTRTIEVGGREAALYFIDGFCKDDLLQKLLQYFMDMKPEDMPQDASQLLKKGLPYIEVDQEKEWEKITSSVLSGIFVLLVEGYREAVLIDARSYPSRGVEEPEKDKVLRGSKDGFVETVVFNTALIRRRIRDTDLRMEMMSAGKSSKTDIVLCYMDSRVDQGFLEEIKQKIRNIRVDSLTMNQESLAECLVPGRWWNPFPKFKYTERPDTAAAQVLEGNVILLVDNSPSAMILPTTIFDVVEEADDYYFPPLTGTYLRLSRLLINLVALIVLSLPCVFGYNIWSAIQPLGEGSTILDLEDFIVSNMMLPVGSLVYLLFCVTRYGWGFDHYLKEANTGEGVRMPGGVRFYVTFILPVLLFFLTVKGWIR